MSHQIPAARPEAAMLRSMEPAGIDVGFRDLLLALVFSALGVLLMVENVNEAAENAPVAAVPVFLLVSVPLIWRRSAPLAAAAGVLAAVLLHTALFGSLTRCGVAFPVAFLMAFATGAYLDRREARIGLGLAVACLVAVTLDDHSVGFDALPFFVPITIAVWGMGRVVRSRGYLITELRARTDELRTTRDERARLEVATDRARLSSELDELLHRRLGELAQLADPAVRPGDADGATATFAAIEREGRRTLDEMRAAVGVLRQDGAAPPTAPQPTLTGLEALVLRAKGDGARLRVEGSPRALPPGVELSAYRIVEHLLDAVEDEPGVEVLVRFGDDALELAVTGASTRRADAALERARERVQLHRGTLRTTMRGDRAEALVLLPVAGAA